MVQSGCWRKGGSMAELPTCLKMSLLLHDTKHLLITVVQGTSLRLNEAL